MKSTAIWISILAIAIALGAFFYFRSGETIENNIRNEEEIETAEGVTETEQVEGEFSGSITELAARGGNHVCTFSHSSAAAESTGTVYISGANIRGDFSSRVQGMTIQSHMIHKEGFVYAWSPLSPTGYKVPATVTSGNGNTEMQAQFADLNQSYTYDCKSWSVDNSKFTIPSMTFMEV